MQQHLVLSVAGRGARGDMPKVRGPDRWSAVSSAWHIQRSLLRAFRSALRCRARGVRRHREYAPLCSRHPPARALLRALLRTPASRECHFLVNPTDAVTKDEIVRALEQGTSAELLVKDWDLSGTGRRQRHRARWFAAEPRGSGSQGFIPAVAHGRGCWQRSRRECRRACDYSVHPLSVADSAL